MNFCPTRAILRSESGSLGRQTNPAKEHVGGDKERRPVFAPAAVGGRLAGVEGAEMSAIGTKDNDAPRAGREHVARLVDLHAVGESFLAGLDPLRGVEEDAALA